MERIRKALEKKNICVTDGMLSQLEAYMNAILEKNEFINLTAITNRDEFVEKHFVDSVLTAGDEEVLAAENIIDVGTGAGFPGVPLAVIFPEKKFVLMDSLAKRLKVIDEICAEAEIRNVTTVHARAEELAKNREHREKYDLCVSRAVANMAVLAEYCLPFIKVGGYFLAYKGPDYEEELNSAKKGIELLGGKVVAVRDADIDALGISHKIVVIKKREHTPAKYPRKAGTPAKEPLV